MSHERDPLITPEKIELLRLDDMSGVGFWIVGPSAIVLVLHGIALDLTLHPEKWTISWLFCRLATIPVSIFAMYILRSKWRDQYSDLVALLVGVCIALQVACVNIMSGSADSKLAHGFVQILLAAAVIPVKPKTFAWSALLIFILNLATSASLDTEWLRTDFLGKHLIFFESYGILAVIIFFAIYKARRVGYIAKIQLEDELEKRQQKINLLVASEVSAKEISLKASISQQVAHDIRSPLTAITAILNQKDLNNSSVQSLLRETISRIGMIASDLLASNLERIQEPSKLEANNLVVCISKLISQKRIELNLDETKLTFQYLTNEEIFDYEPHKIERVLSNLINNAADAIPPKDGKIKVTFGRDNDNFWLTVADNGLGIPQSIKAKLGQRGFSTKKKTESGSGNGLGLYSTISILNDRNGTIAFEETPGGGTTILVKWTLKTVVSET